MAALEVLDAGLVTTVQDLGRPGHAASGVARAGATDALSLVVGNRLVGNADDAPALELTLRGGAYRLLAEHRLVLAGAPFEAHLEAPDSPPRPLSPWTPVTAPAGCVLRVGAPAWGARAYLCVAGGIDASRVLGSASTHLASGLGGRALCAGDRVAIAGGSGGRGGRPLGATTVTWIEAHLRRPALRATEHPHAARFPAGAAAAFWGTTFRVSSRSDRLALRLEGPRIEAPDGGASVTEGLPVGAVEVPGDGAPLVLMPDGPPTGGYPVVAAVATVDLPRLGQARPHERLRFERVAPETARAAWRELAARLDAECPRA